jgi:hypothetical protein
METNRVPDNEIEREIQAQVSGGRFNEFDTNDATRMRCTVCPYI